MKKLAIVGAIIALFAVSTTDAHAAGTNAGAKSAVKRKLANYGGMWHAPRHPTVRCSRTSRSRFWCEWSGLSTHDIQTGNTAGTSGSASVTVYGGHYIAIVF